MQRLMLVAFCLIAWQAQAQRHAMLSFNPAPNTVYDCSCQFHSTQNENGNAVRSELDMTFDVSMIKRTDTSVTLRCAYRKLKMDVAATDLNIHVNSNDPMPTQKQLSEDAGATMLKAVKTLLGHAYTVTVTPRGEVTSVTGFDRILDVAMDSIAFNPVVRSYLRKSFASQFGDEPMRNTFDQMFDVLPARDVQAQDSWTAPATDLVHTVTAVGKLTVELKSHSAGAATDNVVTAGAATLDVKTGLPLRIDLTQTATGTNGQPVTVGAVAVRCVMPSTAK